MGSCGACNLVLAASSVPLVNGSHRRGGSQQLTDLPGMDAGQKMKGMLIFS